MSQIPPLPPEPVQPLPAPLAVLSYADPSTLRPRLLTAIGLLSIVLACLGLLFNLLLGFYALVFCLTASVSGTTATAPAPPPASVPAALTPREAQEAALDIDSKCNMGLGALTDAQTAAVTSALRRSDQPHLCPPSPCLTVSDQLLRVDQDTQKAVTIVFTNGSHLAVDAAGQITEETAAPKHETPSVSMLLSVIALLATLAEFALAIYLFRIGIAVLRQSSRGAIPLWAYVWLKLPLAILAAFAFTWACHPFLLAMTIIPVPSIGRFAPTFLDAFLTYLPPFLRTLLPIVGTDALMLSLLGCCYPLALIFALRTKTVREFYHPTANQIEKAPSSI